MYVLVTLNRTITCETKKVSAAGIRTSASAWLIWCCTLRVSPCQTPRAFQSVCIGKFSLWRVRPSKVNDSVLENVLAASGSIQEEGPKKLNSFGIVSWNGHITRVDVFVWWIWLSKWIVFHGEKTRRGMEESKGTKGIRKWMKRYDTWDKHEIGWQ